MRIYVSNYLSNSISIINYDNLEVEQEVYLDDLIHPHSFCIEKDKNLMYIPSSITGNVYIAKLDTFEIIDTISIGGNINNAIIHNNELYLVNEDTNSIYIVDTNTLKPVTVISVDEMPHGIDINESKKKIYIPCSDSVLRIDTELKTVDNTKKTNMKSWHLKVDKTKNEIYATVIEGKLLILDENTMDIKECIQGYILPIDVVISNAKEKIYVSDMGCMGIVVSDYNTKEVIKVIDVCGYPQGLCITHNDKYLWVSDTQNDLIKIYDTDDYNLIKTIIVGKEPTTILCV